MILNKSPLSTISAICFQLANDAVNCLMFGSLVFPRVRRFRLHLRDRSVATHHVFTISATKMNLMSAIGNYVPNCQQMLRGGGRGFKGLSQEEFVKNLCASPFNQDPHHFLSDPFGWTVPLHARFSIVEKRIKNTNVFCIQNKRNFHLICLKTHSYLQYLVPAEINKNRLRILLYL